MRDPRSMLKSPLAFALIMAAITALAVGVVTFTPEADAADPIKQSRSGICHCPGGDSYEAITRFQAFDTIEACLEADGRHPKRGQGECAPPVAADTEAAVLDLRADLEALSLRVAMLEAESIAALAEEPATPALSRVEAYKLCFEAVEGPSYASYASSTCKSIPVDLAQDFVDCFEFTEPDSYATAAVDECKDLLGIQ